MYEASGWVLLNFLSGNVGLDWTAVGSSPDKGRELILPKGSQIAVAIAERPRAVVGADGASHDAYQATMWASSPAHSQGAPLDFFDQWLDVRDSNLVQATKRNMVVNPESDASFHFMQPTRLGRSPLFFAPMFWESALRPGMSGSLQFSLEVYKPGPTESRTLTYRVEEGVSDPQGRCTVDVSFEYTNPQAYPVSLHATFDGTHPLPVAYSESLEDDGKPALAMGLRSWTTGGGAPLPKFSPKSVPTSGLPVQPLESGFLTQVGKVFPTDFSEALDAARSDDGLGPWLRSHPRTMVSFAQHLMGLPGSKIVDGWEIEWVDPGGEARAAAIIKSNLLGIALTERLDVSEVEPDFPTFPNVTAGVSIDELARLHQKTYRKPPEVLLCFMHLHDCWVGTHASTGEPYWCDAADAPGCSGAVGLRPGLQIWVDRGVLYGDQSWDSASIGPPVRPPAGWHSSG